MKYGSITTGIIADGLAFNMDAANRSSYPRTGPTIHDTVGNVTGTLSGDGGGNNTPQWQDTNKGIFDFDGVDDSIDTSTFTSQPLNHLNIWFSRTAGINTTAISSNQTLLGWGTNGNLSGIWFGNFTSGATDETILLYQAVQGNNLTYIRDTGDSNFHNLTINWNGTTYDMYLDGTLRTTYPGSLGNLAQFNIDHLNLGRSNNSSYYHTGNIANVQIYNRALSSTEILNNYNALKGRFDL